MTNFIGYILLYFFCGFTLAEGWTLYADEEEKRIARKRGATLDSIKITTFFFWPIYLFFNVVTAIEFIIRWIINIFIYTLTHDESKLL